MIQPITLQWIQLETKDLSDYLIEEQLSALAPKNAILQDIIADVCAYIRQRIPSAWLPNPIKANHLPDACKQAACHLVIEALQTRMPELMASEDQVRAADQARKTLDVLFTDWNTQAKRWEPRIEAVDHREHDVKQSTLKGL